jgi:hypothetical protein
MDANPKRSEAPVRALVDDSSRLSDQDIEELDKQGSNHRRQFPERWIHAAEDSARARSIDAGREDALNGAIDALTNAVPEKVWRDHDDAYDVLFREALALVTVDLLSTLERTLLDRPYARFWRARRPRETPPPMGT